MTDWNDLTDKEDKVAKFKQNECVGCGRRAELVNRNKFDYWTGWAFEKGHDDDMEYLWMRHKHDWRCTECAMEWYENHVPGTLNYDESN